MFILENAKIGRM